jgi:H+/Cl- antiporter ClcA
MKTKGRRMDPAGVDGTVGEDKAPGSRPDAQGESRPARMAISRRIVSALCWICLSALIGAAGGFSALLLSIGARAAFAAVNAWHWLIFCLPLFGILTFFLYRWLHLSWDLSTNSVIRCARTGERVPVQLAPAIFAGTLLSLFGGGSVGKEGAALQMGGSLGSAIGERARLSRHFVADGIGWIDRGVFVRMGMCGAFASLMSTPLAATLFVLEITCAPVLTWGTACMYLAALAGWSASIVSGIRPPWLALASSVPVSASLGEGLVVAALCTVFAIAFCLILRWAKSGILSRFPAWARVIAGGIVAVVLTVCFGESAQIGTGEELMAQAFAGSAPAWSFAVKLILTVVVLGSGFKGGEIMPVMAIGASLGCQVGSAFGIDPATSAGVGLVAMLSACSNAPLASMVLGIEAFGPSLGYLYAIVALCSYFLSFYVGLYPANFIGSFRSLAFSLKKRFSRAHARA